MPYKKRLHARFPPARIKKIMQMDEDVGKVSSTVPVMVSRALERFLEYIMTASANVTSSKDARTLTSQHILDVVTSDNRLTFLKEAALKSVSSVSSNPENMSSGSSSNNNNHNKKDKSNGVNDTKNSDENDSDYDA